MFKNHPNGGIGVPNVKPQSLEALKQCHCAPGEPGALQERPGSQRAATEAVCEGLWAPWGGSGTRLGRVWDAPRDVFAVNFDPQLD